MHALETIELMQSEPMQKAQARSMDVTGAARALFATFGIVENTTTRTVVELALSGMTCDEYDNAEKQAGIMAQQADKAAGWTPPADAKGRAKYGPKQSSMATQASNRRQIFGAARLNLAAIVSVPESGIVNPDTFPAFSVAYNKAKTYLKENGIDWTGRATEDARRDRETKAETQAYAKARADVEARFPMQPGETIGQWQSRISDTIEETLVAMQDKEHLAAVKKMAEKVLKEHGKLFALDLAEMLCQMVEPDPETEAPF